jgi:hypothetical protein
MIAGPEQFEFGSQSGVLWEAIGLESEWRTRLLTGHCGRLWGGGLIRALRPLT